MQFSRISRWYIYRTRVCFQFASVTWHFTAMPSFLFFHNSHIVHWPFLFSSPVRENFHRKKNALTNFSIVNSTIIYTEQSPDAARIRVSPCEWRMTHTPRWHTRSHNTRRFSAIRTDLSRNRLLRFTLEAKVEKETIDKRNKRIIIR